MARYDLDFIQINYSAAEPEAARRILPLAASRGMAVLANRPLAGGHLIAQLAKTPVPGWAGDIGCKNWSQVFLKFCIAHPAVTCAIPGTHKPTHVRDNIAAGKAVLYQREPANANPPSRKTALGIADVGRSRVAEKIRHHHAVDQYGRFGRHGYDEAARRDKSL